MDNMKKWEFSSVTMTRAKRIFFSPLFNLHFPLWSLALIVIHESTDLTIRGWLDFFFIVPSSFKLEIRLSPLKLWLEFTCPVTLPYFKSSESKWEIVWDCVLSGKCLLNCRTPHIQRWLWIWRRAERFSVYLGKERANSPSLIVKFPLETCIYIIY